MIRTTLSLPIWMLSALAALSLQPAPAEAGRYVDYECLLPVAETIHATVEQFECIAGQRSFPRHEINYICLMAKRSCRLADGVADRDPYGRIKADYNVLKAFVRVVDRRLERHCEHHRDPHLMSYWAGLKHELDRFGCILDGRPTRTAVHVSEYGQTPPYVPYQEDRPSLRPVPAVPPAFGGARTGHGTSYMGSRENGGSSSHVKKSRSDRRYFAGPAGSIDDWRMPSDYRGGRLPSFSLSDSF